MIESPAKRADIQGLRALSIIAVILFHVWSNYFVNGFLGVDIFFILSGFLMALIISKQPVTITTTGNFYFRRIKRIVPLYLVVMAIVIITGQLIVFGMDYQRFTSDAMLALTFATNVKFRIEESYWRQISTFNFFLHTWSLSVEMQYYLLVPLLFYVFHRIRVRRLRIASCLLLSAASICLQAVVDDQTAFFFLPCRIWQFLVGTTAYYLTEETNSLKTITGECQDVEVKDREVVPAGDITQMRQTATLPYARQLSVILTVSLLLVTWTTLVSGVPGYMLRFLVAVITFLLLTIGVPTTNCILDNPISSYIGDLSYVLYLVQWPVTHFKRYSFVENTMTIEEGILVMIVIAVLSILLHHVIEQPLSRSQFNSKHYMAALIVIYALILNLAYFESPNPDLLPLAKRFQTYSDYIAYYKIPHDTLQRLETKYPIITKIDSQFPADCRAKKQFEQNASSPVIINGRYCETKGSGNLSVLLLGNSHALTNSWAVLQMALKDTYSTFVSFTASYCSPFPGTNTAFNSDIMQSCEQYIRSAIDLAQSQKPDIIFVVAKFSTPTQSPFPVDEGLRSTDRHLHAMQTMLDTLSNWTKVIAIAGPHLHFAKHTTNELGKRLAFGQPLNGLHMTYENHLLANAHAHRRVRALACGKCLWFDYSDAFCDVGGLCKSFDDELRLPYFIDVAHLNLIGLARVFPLLQKVVMEAVVRARINA